MSVAENKPAISVIVPMFNTEKYVEQAIDSILQQTLPVSEIIVIDDGSTDAGAGKVKGYGKKVRYYYQPNKGSGAARNTGVKAAKGDFLAFLDADDLWTTDRIEKQLSEFAANPDLQIVFGHVEQFISPELDESSRSKLREELRQMPGYHVGTMLIKKTTFDKVGLFDEKLQLAEFIDWFNRAKQLNLQYIMLDDVLMKRRIHATNQGLYKKDFRKDYITVLKAAIDRKRNRNTE